MGSRSWAAGDRCRDICPAAVGDLELARPVHSHGNRTARQRRGRAGLHTRAVKVERARVIAGIRREKIAIQTDRHGHGLKDGIDHDAGLKNALDKADEIAAPILHGVVRQTGPVHRQHDEEAVAVALAPAKNEVRAGGGPVGVACAFERALPETTVVHVDAIDGRTGGFL